MIEIIAIISFIFLAGSLVATYSHDKGYRETFEYVFIAIFSSIFGFSLLIMLIGEALWRP